LEKKNVFPKKYVELRTFDGSIFVMKRLQVLEEMDLVRLKLELLSQQSESKQGNMQELRGVD
jgi:hypothetical protein